MKKERKCGKSELYTGLYTFSTAFSHAVAEEKQERPFCEVVIKNEICHKMSKNTLTYAMSKTSKKLVKLLQNHHIICYNAYTINNRKG